ncbi:MAG: hypothetical protein JST30_10165 [Armatimonadetes bacterium]|nr:hypothetical protein [Armatimonadota bacterium]
MRLKLIHALTVVVRGWLMEDHEGERQVACRVAQVYDSPYYLVNEQVHQLSGALLNPGNVGHAESADWTEASLTESILKHIEGRSQRDCEALWAYVEVLPPFKVTTVELLNDFIRWPDQG